MRLSVWKTSSRGCLDGCNGADRVETVINSPAFHFAGSYFFSLFSLSAKQTAMKNELLKIQCSIRGWTENKNVTSQMPNQLILLITLQFLDSKVRFLYDLFSGAGYTRFCELENYNTESMIHINSSLKDKAGAAALKHQPPPFLWFSYS